MQARTITRKVYRGPAVGACKTAFCDNFPHIFTKTGKRIRKARARKYAGARIPHHNEAQASSGNFLQLGSCSACLLRPRIGVRTAGCVLRNVHCKAAAYHLRKLDCKRACSHARS